jgi:hypothetical protein
MIIFKRIYIVWHNQEVLHSGQYNNQIDNGAPMALLNVTNTIEGAIHNQETKTIIFWEIKRAFGSIPRNL